LKELSLFFFVPQDCVEINFVIINSTDLGLHFRESVTGDYYSINSQLPLG